MFCFKPAMLASACALAVLLSACNSGDDTTLPGGGSSSAAVKSADLCVNSTCGELVHLLPIPDAENTLFTSDGRLFVTGGQNVFEVTKAADGTFSSTVLNDSQCSFTGMAVLNGYLYVACSDSRLFAGQLTAHPALTTIFSFTGMCIPNGVALGPDGKIYVVDEPLNVNPPANCLPPNPKIVRLTVDPADPMKISSQETWLQGSATGLLAFGLDNTLRFPNGLTREGNVFFGTDGGSVYSVEIQPDGSPGTVMPLFFEATAHDDLSLVSDGILVADFALGKIDLLSRSGQSLQQTNPLTFSFPSSVRLGKPPMFKTDDIIVTEKGVITDNNLPIDFLSLFHRKPG